MRAAECIARFRDPMAGPVMGPSRQNSKRLVRSATGQLLTGRRAQASADFLQHLVPALAVRVLGNRLFGQLLSKFCLCGIEGSRRGVQADLRSEDGEHCPAPIHPLELACRKVPAFRFADCTYQLLKAL